MKVFKIETRKGFFSIPEKIGNYFFPKSCAASFKGATNFPFKSAAEKTIKKYKLDKAPYFAHIEEYEFDANNV